jgi:peptidoglycan/xylan/chitin deacetylase (PgdA/CDA1 family)
MALERIRSRNLTGLRDLAGYAAGRGIRSPYRNFLEIRGLEEQYDAGSTFFFLATDQDIIRFRYRVEDLTADLESLAGTGAEIGLHGGFASCGSLDAIRAEKGRLERVLGQDVTGYRNHFLRFRVPESWAYLEQAGFSYDSTLGYNHAVGFRNGMVHPFRPFNLRTGTSAGILEIPLVVMERAYVNTRIPPSRAWDSLQAILEMGERCHGVVTVNWHNTSFAGMPDRTWERMYRKLLHYGKERGAWMAGGAEIARFWKETSGS